MIYYLKGKIELKNEKSVIIEVSGVGFKVFCSPATLGRLPLEGKEVKLFTFLYLREEEAELYGFLNPRELELFESLNQISGIGPKTALLLSSFGSLEKLKEIFEQEKLPPEIKGIGKKKIQKILLELTGKIKELKKEKVKDQALEALISLGFKEKQARQALSRVPSQLDSQKRVREALKVLSRTS